MSIGYEEQALVHNCIEAAAITVLFYDHLVTFAEETAYIWARRKHASTILFLVNRYLGCFSTIAQAVMTFTTVSPERCIQYIHCRQALLVVNHATVCILFILRTYALYGRNNRLLTLLILTSITLASVVAWSLVGQQATTATDVPGCQMIYNNKTAIHFAVSYEALCVFDTLIFGLTMYKTSKVGVQSSGHSKPDLVVLLLRDGAIYFGIVAFANLANIVSFYAAPVRTLSSPSHDHNARVSLGKMLGTFEGRTIYFFDMYRHYDGVQTYAQPAQNRGYWDILP